MFRPAHLPSREHAKRDYERARGSARERGYTAAWDAASLSYKADHPLCVGCLVVGEYRAVEVVDHIVPHKGDMSLFWDGDNWQSACSWHHDVVKQRLEAMYVRDEIRKVDLRLDSETARRLTRLLQPSSGGGLKV